MPVRKVLDPEKWATKAAERGQAAGADWLDGVENPSVSPVEAMRKGAARYKAEMMKALNEGRWDKAIARLTDEAIASAARRSGPGAFSTGIANAQEKIRAAIGRLQPKVAALKAQLDAMPTETDAQREAKMVAAMRGMKKIGEELAAAG